MLSRWTLSLLLLSGAPAVAAAGQNSVPAPGAAAPVKPAVPQTVTPQTVVPAPLPAPVVLKAEWSRDDASDLLDFVDRIGEEGLDPADYRVDALRQAVAGTGEDVSPAATQLFLKLVSDLMFGHTPASSRLDWHLADDNFNVHDQQALLDRATAGGAVADTLRSLLPTHPQYAALKALYATTEDGALREKIKVNLDRWRWLPRDLGSKYVIVNVPAYTVALVENGTTLNRRRRSSAP